MGMPGKGCQITPKRCSSLGEITFVSSGEDSTLGLWAVFIQLNYISLDVLCCSDSSTVTAPRLMVTCMIPVLGECQQREEKAECQRFGIQGSKPSVALQ